MFKLQRIKLLWKKYFQQYLENSKWVNFFGEKTVFNLIMRNGVVPIFRYNKH